MCARCTFEDKVFQLPDHGEAKEIAMNAIKFLATLVALCLMNGCYALTGQCAGGGLGPQCTEDGSTYYGSDASNNDASYDGAPNPDTVGNDTIGQEVATKCKYAGIVDDIWLLQSKETALNNKEFIVRSELGAISGKCKVVFVDAAYALEDGVKLTDTNHMHVCWALSTGCDDFTRKTPK